MATAAPQPVIARFQFFPDRVEEFSFGGEFVPTSMAALSACLPNPRSDP